ncbi:hypothetical protein [uncultured Roseobacter sp.]|uniref:hypothetical protein n=1 Tax=uncultured Roseobacter sp. TaxID=114847 RepID=UPI0026170067|nr:hypothetical protein [uncultured Roseobacter sp.]
MTDRGKIVFGALLGFVISGIGGYYFKAWADRPIPRFEVLALELDGGAVNLENEDLVKINSTIWGRDVNRTETFSSLLEREAELASTESDLKKARRAVDDWLVGNPLSDLSDQMKLASLRSVPLVSSSVQADDPTRIILATIDGMMRRKELRSFSFDEEEIMKLNRVAPVYHDIDGDPVIQFGREAIVFIYHQNYSDRERDLVKNIVEGISRGHGPVIRWIHDIFSKEAAKDLASIQEARDTIQEILVRQANIKLAVILVNDGNTPTTSQPYFRAEMSYGDERRELVFSAQKRQNSAEGPSDDTISPPSYSFRSGLEGGSYVNAPANASTIFEVTSDSKLGNDGKLFSDFFAAGQVGIKLVGLNTKDQPIFSPKTFFGRRITQASDQKLADALRADN